MAHTLLGVCGFPLVWVNGVCEDTVVRRLLLLSDCEDRRSKNDKGKERRKREASTRRPARAWHGGSTLSTIRVVMPGAGYGCGGNRASMSEGWGDRIGWPDFETLILSRAGS